MNGISLLLGLFSTAFAAATILPVQSEILLTALLLKSEYAPVILVAVASFGNVLGSCVNWWLGRYIEHFHDKKWFPLKGDAFDRAQRHYNRWGRWSLVLSWVPFIGDPITVMSGVMKERLTTFVLLVTLAKTGRYIVVAMLALQYTKAAVS